MADKLPIARSSARDIEAFLKDAGRVPSLAQAKGRLVFAIDATLSRAPTWDAASEIQSDMFEVAQDIGGLAVQLVWFRGRGEFRASGWTTTPAALGASMRDVVCASGFTQLRRVLAHVRAEAASSRVGALVYIGDCFEENAEVVLKEAGALAMLGVPAFMFHEGRDENAAAVFGEIARLTRGVYARFDSGAADRLRELLRAAAVYATGGRLALRDYGERVGGEVKRIAHTISGQS
jgi:hypothetical protein